jgi:hypothetical protein
MCQCSSLKQFCSRSFLLIVNCIDGTAGILLLTYASYLTSKDYAPIDVYFTLIILGMLLIVTALFGTMGISWPRTELCCNVYYSSLLIFSSYLAIPVALLEITSATMLFVRKDYIVKEGHARGVDESVIDDITNPMIPIALLALCVMECFRLFASKFLRGAVVKDVLKYKLMKEEEKEEEKRVAQERSDKIGSKYSAYREKFKNKYNMDTPKTGSAVEAQSQL